MGWSRGRRVTWAVGVTYYSILGYAGWCHGLTTGLGHAQNSVVSGFWVCSAPAGATRARTLGRCRAGTCFRTKTTEFRTKNSRNKSSGRLRRGADLPTYLVMPSAHGKIVSTRVQLCFCGFEAGAATGRRGSCGTHSAHRVQKLDAIILHPPRARDGRVGGHIPCKWDTGFNAHRTR